jgi:hypothetical protein
MQRKIQSFAVSAALGLALATGALAATPSPQEDRSTVTQQLERRLARVDSELSGKTGALQRSKLMAQRRQLRELIEKARRGEPVDPAEVDRLLAK